MKITSVRVSESSADRGATAAPLLVLGTDTSLSGIGEIFVRDRAQAFEPMSTMLSAMLVGRDPFDVLAMTADVSGRSGATALESAIAAAAGTAMADIAGQDLGVPVHQLLGGRVRDRVRACAIGWAAGASGTSELAAAAVQTVGLGFTALRVDPFIGSRGSGATQLTEATTLVRSLRDALPDEIDIVVNAGGALRNDDAVAFAEALAPLEPLWLEAPVAASRLTSFGDVSDRVTLPLAGGRGTERDILRTLVTRGYIDHVVLEIERIGGLLEARRIAALAEIYHIGIIPTCTAPVSLATALHLAAAVPNLTMIELLPGLASVENGTLAVDLNPGLGIDPGLATTMEVA
jgi:galactonate dehydratase